MANSAKLDGSVVLQEIEMRKKIKRGSCRRLSGIHFWLLSYFSSWKLELLFFFQKHTFFGLLLCAEKTWKKLGKKITTTYFQCLHFLLLNTFPIFIGSSKHCNTWLFVIIGNLIKTYKLWISYGCSLPICS